MRGDKLTNVFQTQVKCGEELVAVGEKLGGYLFRGHGSTKWKLETTLERAALLWNVERATLLRRERVLLSEFKRRAHHYINDPPKDDEHLEWAALLQHYGGPTRLIDVTRSYLVAAFFAVEKAEDDGIIWAFNPGRLEPEEESDEELILRHSLIIKANSAFLNNSKRGVILVEPFRLNRRLAAQQGAFLMPLSINSPFCLQLQDTLNICLTPDQLCGLKDVTPDQLCPIGKTVGKIVIPRDKHSEIMRFLARANITTSALFEGLEGFARSLHLMMMLYN